MNRTAWPGELSRHFAREAAMALRGSLHVVAALLIGVMLGTLLQIAM